MTERWHRWRAAVEARLRTTNDYVVDTAVVAAVAVPTSVPFVSASPGDVTVLGAVLNAGTVLPLIWRRRAPFAVAVVVAGFATLVSLYDRPGQMLQFAGLVGIYTLAELGRAWQRRGFLAAIFVTFPPASVFVKHNTAAEFIATLLLPLTAYLLGSLVRISRTREQARAERSDRERSAEAARAVAQERARIAREMHDVLAHAVSVMVVQAEAGPLYARSDPDRTAQIFEVIASVGRDATDQLARTLDLLKAEDDVGMRAPQPSVAEVPALVDLMHRAGLRVELRTEGDPRPLPAEAEVAAYRIVQEAMTNTIRHAGAASADVRLEWQPDGLSITVTDDGRTDSYVPSRSGGHGLIGIRERARACGGHAEAGPASTGGFRITAWLPCSASVPSDANEVSGR